MCVYVQDAIRAFFPTFSATQPAPAPFVQRCVLFFLLSLRIPASTTRVLCGSHRFYHVSLYFFSSLLKLCETGMVSRLGLEGMAVDWLDSFMEFVYTSGVTHTHTHQEEGEPETHMDVDAFRIVYASVCAVM